MKDFMFSCPTRIWITVSANDVDSAKKHLIDRINSDLADGVKVTDNLRKRRGHIRYAIVYFEDAPEVSTDSLELENIYDKASKEDWQPGRPSRSS